MDRIFTSDPVDRTARMVTSEGEPPLDIPPWVEKHVIESPPNLPKFRGRAQDDLTGQRIGYFTVIGYWEQGRKQNKKSRWLVRCDCGIYVCRKGKLLRDPKPGKRIMCGFCWYVECLK